MEEQTATARVYSKDLLKLGNFMEKHPGMKTADAIRVCVEYTDAHGALK
jgi:hypothetical protein